MNVTYARSSSARRRRARRGVGPRSASACGGGDVRRRRRPSRPPRRPPRRRPPRPSPIPTAPLTGLHDPSGASLTRPAVSVKVENTPTRGRRPASTRPTSSTKRSSRATSPGSSRSSTRTVPDVIGPVRSVRAEDPDIVWPLGGIFAYSGGAPVNVDADQRRAGPRGRREQRSERRDGAQRSRASRRAARRTTSTRSGRPLFDARRATRSRRRRCSSTCPTARRRSTAPGIARASASGSTPGYDPTSTWDGAIRYVEALDPQGVPHTVVGGAQIAPANVVVQFTHVRRRGRGADRRRGRRVGLHRRHRCAAARWVRPDQAQPARYVDATGRADPAASRAARGSSCCPVGSTVDLVDAPPPATTAAAHDRPADHHQEEEVGAQESRAGTAGADDRTDDRHRSNRNAARVKRGLAEMLRGGVIMDVVTPEQAKIAEDAGAVAVMALERVPADIRRDGGVARMSDPAMIEGIQAAVTIPVMAKCRIGHFARGPGARGARRRLHRRERGAHPGRRGVPRRQVGRSPCRSCAAPPTSARRCGASPRARA